MCIECNGLRELVAHIEQAAEILEGRLTLFSSRFGHTLPAVAGEAYAEVSYDTTYLIRAVSRLRPLIDNEPHQN